LEKNILGISLYIFNVIFRGISYIFEKLIVIHIKLINFVKDCLSSSLSSSSWWSSSFSSSS